MRIVSWRRSARSLNPDGLPLVGGALTLAAPHPIIARRTWLWRADTGAVIEAVGFGFVGPAVQDQEELGRDWLAGLGAGSLFESAAGPPPSSPLLTWALSRPLTENEAAMMQQVARFAVAPLAAISTRSSLAALLETYLGRRSAAQVLAGRLRRETGETIRAVLLYGDLRGFTELSEAMPPNAVVAALDAWFDRIAGAVHAFGGEVLKFIGDGVLAIFPIGEKNSLRCLRFRLTRRRCCRRRNGSPRSGARRPRPSALALRHGASPWRDVLGQYRHADRLDFTAIGRAVNLVSRLEGLCKPLQRNVLISGAFAAEATNPLLALGAHELRGIEEPCEVFTLPQ